MRRDAARGPPAAGARLPSAGAGQTTVTREGAARAEAGSEQPGGRGGPRAVSEGSVAAMGDGLGRRLSGAPGSCREIPDRPGRRDPGNRESKPAVRGLRVLFEPVCFSSSLSFPLAEQGTRVCVEPTTCFACAQLLKLSLHITRFKPSENE